MADVPTPSSAFDMAPDLMNDPQYATNIPGGDDGMGDADTCRICRGEGSDSEPLFHPCKCSGSIKYVHQDCLMEWLSHSQKKHCELCKTAFRFTKLYSPNMPQTLPYHVLFRHVVIHTAKNLGIWLRFCVVVTVWLGFLPYIIRQVWRLLFWFSDGGWPVNYHLQGTSSNTTLKETLEVVQELQRLASITTNGTSPVSPLQASQTSSASVSGVMSQLSKLLLPFTQALNGTLDPLANGFFKSVLYGFGNYGPEDSTNANANATLPQSFTGPPSYKSPSLLSEVSFLRNLTRSSHINQLVITVAEGYVITIVVVICFILVFLIREWVVQQQPGINMGAGFNAEFVAPERPREQIIQEEEPDAVGRPIPHVNILGNRPEPGQRQIAPARRLLQPAEEGVAPQPDDTDALHEQEYEPLVEEEEEEEGEEEEALPHRPPLPVRDALSLAAEIQRQLEEPKVSNDFVDIWRRAGADPDEVLRIIEKENKGHDMRHYVNAMKILESPHLYRAEGSFTAFHTARPGSPLESETSSPFDHLSPGPGSRDPSIGRRHESDGSSANSDGWIDVSQPPSRARPIHTSTPDHSSSSSDKGKGRIVADSSPANPGVQGSEKIFIIDGRDDTDKATAKSNELELPQIPRDESGSLSSMLSQNSLVASRPRAVSDGPQPRDTISPLANNKWTFTNIPESTSSRLPEASIHREALGLSSDQSQLLHPSQANGLFDAKSARNQDAIFEDHEPHDLVTGPGSDLDSGDLNSESEGPVIILGLDGITRTYANWDEVNPDEDQHSDGEPETQIPVHEPILAPRPEPQGFLAHLADFLWGGIGVELQVDDQGENDERVVQNIAAEAPFVPVHPREEAADINEQDREVVEAAIAAGIDPNDQDAIDDAEDFEGIMELVGMRGPLFSLIQNALFSAFLLALTVAIGAWIPYNIGRVSLLLLANPGPAFKLPLRLIFGFAAFLQDLALSLAGAVSYCLIAMLSLPITLWTNYTSSSSSSLAMQGLSLGSAALRVSRSALDRIMDSIVRNFIYFTDSEILPFSAASHEALINLQSLLVDSVSGLGSRVIYLLVGDYRITMAGCYSVATEASKLLWQSMLKVPAFATRPDSWVISLALDKREAPLNLELSAWSSADRFWATIAGYTAISVLGALYVKKGSPFSSGQVGREWEATILDLLNQAGGVMKVILIISIEMLVFPLYCGLLLDAALLPLFDNTTIMSRLLFTLKSPLTSIFVHWFVGTCYMFHFALFVSMCRKIMRKGVLCEFSSFRPRAVLMFFRLHSGSR